MKSHILSLGFYIWKSVVDGYTEPNSLPTHVASKEKCENNQKARNVILCRLTNPLFTKVMHCK